MRSRLRTSPGMSQNANIIGRDVARFEGMTQSENHHPRKIQMG
jgi:hypothetical protein